MADMEKSGMEKIIPFLMDGMYVLSLALSLLGFRLVPFTAVPYLMVPSYIALFWIYRQVREFGIGSGGAPLLEQLGFTIPRFIHWVLLWTGVFVYFLFPFYIGVLMAVSFDPSFDDPAHWSAGLKLLAGFFTLALVIFTWFCLASDRDKDKSMPEKRQDIYLRRVLPVSALLLGESAASLSDLIHSAWGDSGADAMLAVTVFIPLRLVLMRAVGASKPGILSFIVAAILSVVSMIIR